jgi:predicted site-specific integrase-resolvase
MSNVEPWWEEKKKKSRRALAYYRHSAQDRQKNSIEIQRDAVRKFADENDMEIIAEFEDAGKSGLNAEGRKGFQALLERVKQRDVSNVICNDASRWGRFQDIYKAADYERQCAEYGAEVVYVVDGNLKEESHDNVGIEDDAIFHAIRRTMNSGSIITGKSTSLPPTAATGRNNCTPYIRRNSALPRRPALRLP